MRLAVPFFCFIAIFIAASRTSQAGDEPSQEIFGKWVATSRSATALVGNISAQGNKLISSRGLHESIILATIEGRWKIMKIQSEKKSSLTVSMSICGGEPARWIAFETTNQSEPRDLLLYFFSGEEVPDLPFDRNLNLCGTFGFSRKN